MLVQRGEANTIELPQSVNGQLRVLIHGDRNHVRMAATPRTVNLKINIRASDCEVLIGEQCVLVGDFSCLADASKIHVGAKTTMLGARLQLHEAGQILIGQDCMLAGDISMNNSDVHSIVDLASRQRINPPADVTVHDHVWLGQGVRLLKGVSIGEHSVVGAGSVVTSAVPTHCVAAGVPARVIRTGITWDRKLLPLKRLAD